MIQHRYILVIDNDPLIGDLISEALTDEGYIVLAASMRVQTLPPVAEHRPALCLVDVGVSGLEVLEPLRTRGLVHVPMVVMTASTHHAERARAAGYVCLDKPFDLDELLACVADYVPLPLVATACTA